MKDLRILQNEDQQNLFKKKLMALKIGVFGNRLRGLYAHTLQGGIKKHLYHFKVWQACMEKPVKEIIYNYEKNQ